MSVSKFVHEARAKAAPGTFSPPVDRGLMASLYPKGHAYIYALSDPRTGKVRYVGKAFDVCDRFGGHLKDKGTTHKACWIKGLKAAGLAPELDVVDILPADDEAGFFAAERRWIDTFRQMGYDLTNLMEGGGSGGRHNPVTLEKMSRVHKALWTDERKEKQRALSSGRKHSPEAIERMRKAHAVISDETRAKLRLAHSNISEETRAKMSAAMKGRKMSAAAREKISAANTGSKRTPEQRERMRLAALNQSPEKRAKISAALTGRKRSDEVCRKMSESKRGWNPPESWRSKQSLAKKGKPTGRIWKPSEETKSKMRSAQQERRRLEAKV